MTPPADRPALRARAEQAAKKFIDGATPTEHVGYRIVSIGEVADLIEAALLQLHTDAGQAGESAGTPERTLRSIAAMLGWVNVPPRHVLEAEIRALKARAIQTEPSPASQEIDPAKPTGVARWLREQMRETADAIDKSQPMAAKLLREGAHVLMKAVDAAQEIERLKAERDDVRRVSLDHVERTNRLMEGLRAALDGTAPTDEHPAALVREVGARLKAADQARTDAERARDEAQRGEATLKAEVERLSSWQAKVTVALGRPGGVFFEDVPKHIHALREQLADAEKERESIGGQCASAERELNEAYGKLSASDQAHAQMRAVLVRVDEFLTNGIELGFIRMPDADCPDPAKLTPGLVRAALGAPAETP